MTKYIIGEILSSGGATLYKNPSDQTVIQILIFYVWKIFLLFVLGLSPLSTMSKSSLNERSPYENINNSTSSFSVLKTPQSPRTQIRTMLPPVLSEQRDNEQQQQHVS